MNPLSLDQRAHENGPEDCRLRAWDKTVDIDSTRNRIELLFWRTQHRKGFGGFLRKHQQQIGCVVFREAFLAADQQPVEPPLRNGRVFHGELLLSFRRQTLSFLTMPS